jgi:hypothetical protein
MKNTIYIFNKYLLDVPWWIGHPHIQSFQDNNDSTMIYWVVIVYQALYQVLFIYFIIYLFIILLAYLNL